MSNSSTMDNSISSLVSRRSSSTTAPAPAPAPAPAHSNLSLNLVIQYIDKVLSAITNKDVLDSGIHLRDLVQPTSSDLSKLLQGISEGAKMISSQLVYVRGRVDSMKSDLVLQMQVLIMSTLTFYISTHHGQHAMIDEINSFTLTEQLPFQPSNDVHCEIQHGSETELAASSSNRQDNYNEINGHRQPEMAPLNFLSAGRFLRRILPRIFPRRLKTSSCMEFEVLVKKIQPSAIEFTGKELRNATNGFAEELGKGAFGTVYFGTLLDGRKVAVKLIVRKGKEEWWEKELAVLTRKHHPNVVKLVGYCFKGDLMLVYEYMAGGNLSDLLLREENQQIIDWHARMKIICDIIEGLVYLHEGAGGCVVHRDIKPINILLDEHLNAKICDFGISHIMTWIDSGVPPRQYAQEETIVAGTLGYIDPEYIMSGKLTKKADIYSFGILLLNIVSGKKSIIQTDEGPYLLEYHVRITVPSYI